MRRFLSFLFLMCLCLLCAMALAEIQCECGQAKCICFIQLGDGGPEMEFIQHALIAQGYLHTHNDADRFDSHTLQAVLRFQEANGLPTTGMLDDQTLTLLLWGMLPDELDKAEPSSNGRPIWLPTDGGIRRHRNKACCGMFDPRLVSVRNADLMNMQPCGICNRGGKKE